MQCQRSRVVMCWHKSCIFFPFLLMAVIYVAENMISLKTRSETVPLLSRSSATWPGPVNIFFFWPKAVQRMPHKLRKISARSIQRFCCCFRKTRGGGIPLHGWGLTRFLLILVNQAHHCVANSIPHRSLSMKIICIVFNAIRNAKIK